jgi:hypothetical protein
LTPKQKSWSGTVSILAKALSLSRVYFHRKPADSNKGWFPSLNQQFQQDPNPIDLKPVRVELTLEKFFSHFKRFDVTMMRQGIEMTGREYRETE